MDKDKREDFFNWKKIKTMPFEIWKAQLIGYIRHSKFQKVQWKIQPKEGLKNTLWKI
jgi:hypothetical protein